MALGSLTSNAIDTESLRRHIDRRLAEYVDFSAGCPDSLREAMRYSLLAPGKRLRPLIVVLAHQACGRVDGDPFPAACAVEMVHTYSLVHDDLPAMDDDNLRRGQPTCHVQFGEATAILVGDALLTRAFDILANDVRPAETAVRCVQTLAKAAGATQLIGGQAADLAAENQPLTVVELASIHTRKTAALFSAAASIGGLTAGADPRQIEVLADFGRLFGLSFQITDDLLDVHGQSNQLGKHTHKDQGRGKSTYPRLIGDAASRAQSRELIEQALGRLVEFGQRAEALRTLVEQLADRKQ